MKVLDTKCPPNVDCWFCKDSCISCMELSAPQFTSVISDGLMQFCSKKCEEYFVGQDIPLQVSAVLMNPFSFEAIECCGGDHKPMLSIFAFARGGGKGTKFSLKICRLISPNHETESSQYYAHYRVRQLFSQFLGDLLISSNGMLLQQLVCSSTEMFTPKSSYATVEHHLLEATKVLFQCHNKFMKTECSSNSTNTMTIFLDCSQEMILHLRTLATNEAVHLLMNSIKSYRIVSEVSSEWSSKQISFLLLCINHFRDDIKSVPSESCENILNLLLLLQRESIAGTANLCIFLVSYWYVGELR